MWNFICWRRVFNRISLFRWIHCWKTKKRWYKVKQKWQRSKLNCKRFHFSFEIVYVWHSVMSVFFFPPLPTERRREEKGYKCPRKEYCRWLLYSWKQKEKQIKNINLTSDIQKYGEVDFGLGIDLDGSGKKKKRYFKTS